jgi:hypothetical protein
MNNKKQQFFSETVLLVKLSDFYSYRLIGTGPRPSSQDGVSQLQESASLVLPQRNLLIESSFVRDETSTSSTDVTVIPSQFKVSKQILIH